MTPGDKVRYPYGRPDKIQTLGMARAIGGDGLVEVFYSPKEPKVTLMRIGIFPPGNPHSGGIYQYGLTMLQALYDHQYEGSEDEFVVFSSQALPFNLRSQPPNHWAKAIAEPTVPRNSVLDTARRIVGEGPHREAWRWLRRTVAKQKALARQNQVELQRLSEQFHAERVKLLLYPSPDSIAFEIKVPYVMAVHDLQHRFQPEFPEVSAYGEWERREYVFRNGTRCATLLLADSEVGKEDILNCYGHQGVTADQVKVLPFLPAYYLRADISEEERRRLRAVHKLPEQFVFYPAQFWPHKNHKRIVQALALLKERGMAVDAVFCGAHTGQIRDRTFREVMSLARRLKVEKNIRYLGYVSNQEISGMYAEARALIMPTFFGPTNIPVLEAWAFGCPVLASDIRGIRQQVQDAGILVEPHSVESIADGIEKLWTNNSLCQTLASRGRERLADYTPADYKRRLIEIIEEGKLRLRASRHQEAEAI